MKTKTTLILLGAVGLFLACTTNPFTGKKTLALVPNSQILPMAFQQYDAFLSENNVVTNTSEALMVKRVGEKIKNASETEKIVKTLKNNRGVYLVPAFTGLGAPYWDANSRGVLCGLTRDTGPKEIVRAIIESVAYQTYDLFEAMKNDGLRPKVVKVDGGMVKNNWLLQFLADVIKIRVDRPQFEETTALGAAFLAGLQIGIFKSLNDISKKWKIVKFFRVIFRISIVWARLVLRSTLWFI